VKIITVDTECIFLYNILLTVECIPVNIIIDIACMVCLSVAELKYSIFG